METCANDDHNNPSSTQTELLCDEYDFGSSNNNINSNLVSSTTSSTSSSSTSDPVDKKISNADLKRKKNRNEPIATTKLTRSSGDWSDQSVAEDDDAETAEWAKLRCTSERTEVIAERENRRQKKCADYPGLAFGRSIFSSDSMMKFNIIRNELQNIMNNQLRRVRHKLHFDLIIQNMCR
jgi:hypothetical protein